MFNLRPIADSLPAITEKALGKKGTLFGKLVLNWTTIVGPDIAAKANPKEIRMQRGKSARGPNTARLHLQVNCSADAFELSYQLPQLMDRINAFFGYQAVGDIKLVHTPK